MNAKYMSFTVGRYKISIRQTPSRNLSIVMHVGRGSLFAVGRAVRKCLKTFARQHMGESTTPNELHWADVLTLEFTYDPDEDALRFRMDLRPSQIEAARQEVAGRKWGGKPRDVVEAFPPRLRLDWPQ